MKITEDLLIASSKQVKSKSEPAPQFIQRITHLSLNDKGITKIERLEQCHKLETLYLYDNKITVIENLGSLGSHLTALYLQNNRITSMKGLGLLKQLTKLYLRQVRMVEDLRYMEHLVELNVSNQGTQLTFEPESISGIQNTLTTLDISRNQSPDLTPLVKLHRLKVMHLTACQFESFEPLEEFLSQTSITSLDLKENLVCKDIQYRKRIVTAARSLGRIYYTSVINQQSGDLDGKEVPSNERQFLQKLALKKSSRQEKSELPQDDLF
ncbi:leucine-rich repeat-containing protein 67-like [Planoprotostelium fungivorum]|uniref:Leucine-rich repeat-containing protein 67-like n=1 Tax=Planoprotostelium fungivorum TaxID=1890364 RepID=A0A2P6NGA1_9EUKA|nr:leucine-rich repeat-containing protein 67-like [Planoprotostelium fungivorum]